MTIPASAQLADKAGYPCILRVTGVRFQLSWLVFITGLHPLLSFTNVRNVPNSAIHTMLGDALHSKVTGK